MFCLHELHRDGGAAGLERLALRGVGVEFTPLSAPGLFCRVDLDHPGETQGAKRHPTEQTVHGRSQENLPNDPFLVRFDAQGLFPGARVHYRMLMSDGSLQELLGPPRRADWRREEASRTTAWTSP